MILWLLLAASVMAAAASGAAAQGSTDRPIRIVSGTQTGTSGHPYSAHYVDQLDAWAAGETFPWPFSRGAVEQARQDELILSPQGSSG